MEVINLHAVARQDFILKEYPDFQELLDERIDPNIIPERFYCGGRGGWTFQTALALKYYYGDSIHITFGSECRSDAINLMHNDDFGSRVKPWLGCSVVARADRPPVIGADYVVEQNPAVEGLKNRIFIPYWPQPGLQPRLSKDETVRTVAYFGRVDSFPVEYQSAEFKERLAKHGILLRISFDNWTDYRDVDICLSFRKSHDYKLNRKPASKLINCLLAGAVMICDDEPSFRSLAGNARDSLYITAKTPDDVIDAILRLKNSPELYRDMRNSGESLLSIYSRKAVAARWLALFNHIWHSRCTSRPKFIRQLRFSAGRIIRPITKKY